MTHDTHDTCDFTADDGDHFCQQPVAILATWHPAAERDTTGRWCEAHWSAHGQVDRDDIAGVERLLSMPLDRAIEIIGEAYREGAAVSILAAVSAARIDETGADTDPMRAAGEHDLADAYDAVTQATPAELAAARPELADLPIGARHPIDTRTARGSLARVEQLARFARVSVIDWTRSTPSTVDRGEQARRHAQAEIEQAIEELTAARDALAKHTPDRPVVDICDRCRIGRCHGDGAETCACTLHDVSIDS